MVIVKSLFYIFIIISISINRNAKLLNQFPISCKIMDKRACDMCWWLLRYHVLQNHNPNDKEHSDDHETEFAPNDLSNVGFYQFFEMHILLHQKNLLSIWSNITVRDSLARIWIILLSDDTISKIFRSRTYV